VNREEILKRLLDGENPNSIADEMVKAFNEAQKEYDYIQEEEKRKAKEEEELLKIRAEEAKREEEELQAEIDKRVYLVQQMENAVMDYIAECHPGLYEKMAEGSIGAESALDIASSIDTMCAMLEMLL
jgi:hypothetical protein